MVFSLPVKIVSLYMYAAHTELIWSFLISFNEISFRRCYLVLQTMIFSSTESYLGKVLNDNSRMMELRRSELVACLDLKRDTFRMWTSLNVFVQLRTRLRWKGSCDPWPRRVVREAAAASSWRPRGFSGSLVATRLARRRVRFRWSPRTWIQEQGRNFFPNLTEMKTLFCRKMMIPQPSTSRATVPSEKENLYFHSILLFSSSILCFRCSCGIISDWEFCSLNCFPAGFSLEVCIAIQAFCSRQSWTEFKIPTSSFLYYYTL